MKKYRRKEGGGSYFCLPGQEQTRAGFLAALPSPPLAARPRPIFLFSFLCAYLLTYTLLSYLDHSTGMMTSADADADQRDGDCASPCFVMSEGEGGREVQNLGCSMGRRLFRNFGKKKGA